LDEKDRLQIMTRSRSASSRSRSNSRRRSPEKRDKDSRKSAEPRRIWVGGLDDRTNDSDMMDAFDKFGKVVEVKIRSTARDTFAFVEFDKHSDAKEAIDTMDQAHVRGNKVKCNWASFKAGDSSSSRRSGRYQSNRTTHSQPTYCMDLPF